MYTCLVCGISSVHSPNPVVNSVAVIVSRETGEWVRTSPQLTTHIIST